MLLRLCLGLCALLPGAAAAQDSNAARYLAAQEIAAACDAGGTFGSGGLIERDLTGDGRDDLILDHGAISCDGESRRSG
jgi:hypothetical protein